MVLRTKRHSNWPAFDHAESVSGLAFISLAQPLLTFIREIMGVCDQRLGLFAQFSRVENERSHLLAKVAIVFREILARFPAALPCHRDPLGSLGTVALVRARCPMGQDQRRSRPSEPIEGSTWRAFCHDSTSLARRGSHVRARPGNSHTADLSGSKGRRRGKLLLQIRRTQLGQEL